MNTYAANFEWGNTKTSGPNFTGTKVCIQRFSGWALMGIKMILEYGLGMHMGALIGHTIGTGIGNCYMDHYASANLCSMEGIQQWLGLPCVFATYGLIIGIAVLMIIITIINRRLLYKNIVNLHKNGVTNIEEISRLLLCSKWTARKIFNQLPKD